MNEDGDPLKVRTKLFRSHIWDVPGETPILTVHKIQVGEPGANGLYPQGVPAAGKETKIFDGDGTVLTLSSTEISSNISFESSFTEGHARLMYKYSNLICQFLNDDVPCAAVFREPVQEMDTVAGQTGVTVLKVSLSGRVQPYLLDPNGMATGIRTDTGDLEQAIPGSSVVVYTGGAGLSVDDPVDGTYELSLTALPQEVFTVNVGYTDAAGTEQVSW